MQVYIYTELGNLCIWVAHLGFLLWAWQPKIGMEDPLVALVPLRSYLATKACQSMVQELKEDGSKGPTSYSDNQSDIFDWPNGINRDQHQLHKPKKPWLLGFGSSFIETIRISSELSSEL